MQRDMNDYAYLNNIKVFEKPIAKITAIGVAIPERIVDNIGVVETVEAPWSVKAVLAKLIQRTTGAKDRVYAEPGTAPSDLAVQAAHDAFTQCAFGPEGIDTLIFSSTDTDMLEPSTASIVADKLGIKMINAFDVSSACNSVLQAYNVAAGLIAIGESQRVLIVSGEIGSYPCCRKIKNLKELHFKMGGLTLGDAGCALVVEESDNGAGLLEVNLQTIGEYHDLCHVPENMNWRAGAERGIDGWFYLDMAGLAKVARESVLEYFAEYKRFRKEAFQEDNFMDSLSWVVPHQISKKLIWEIADAVGIPREQMALTVHLYGNTASTSIPLALRYVMEMEGWSLGSGKEVMLIGAASGFCIGHLRVRL